jgi:hypothetical protein
MTLPEAAQALLVYFLCGAAFCGFLNSVADHFDDPLPDGHAAFVVLLWPFLVVYAAASFCTKLLAGLMK